MEAINLSKQEIVEFRSTILDYYKTHNRNFPWRETDDPYYVLVSEFMLQQTQTQRVLLKYQNWVSVFPTLESVAQAPLEEIYSHWMGLGYNRRARYLQDTCKIILTEYQGIVPKNPTELLKLPGIGPYTAHAISTFAYNQTHVFIETNIRSVFLFFFFTNKDVVHDNEILPLIAQTLYTDNPKLWYYALMDYGVFLKQTTVNPNRKSKHYTKQSKFEGSNRQARGAVLKILISKKSTICALEEETGFSYERIKTALDSLKKENFVSETNGVYSIYSS